MDIFLTQTHQFTSECLSVWRTLIMNRCTLMDFQSPPAIIKLGRARTFFFNITCIRLKEQCHIHLGKPEGE